MKCQCEDFFRNFYDLPSAKEAGDTKMPKVKSALKNRGRQAGTADAAGSAGGARQGMVFNTGENLQDERW